MSSPSIDYRVSRLIVFCKDCGDDVGVYPSRHKCRTPERPPLPTLVVPKEEQVVTTYWEMLKSTLWSAEGSTTASEESPGGIIWNKMMDATITVARVVGVGTAEESDSDEDENGETKVTRELKSYYEKKGEGIPEFLLNKSGRSEQEDRKELGHTNWDNESRQAKIIIRKAPIPIRKAPLRDEDDEQEQMRRREKEQAERERERERQREVEADRKRESRKRKEERRRTEREAALAALDGKRDIPSSASSSRKGPLTEPMRPAEGRVDPRTENYNERLPPQRRRPPLAQYGISPSANERSRGPEHPQTYDQQPTYRRAPPPALGSIPSRSNFPIQPPPRSPAGSGSLIPPEYLRMRSDSPSRSRIADRGEPEHRLRGDFGRMDAAKPLIDRRMMMDFGQSEPRYAMREPRRKDQRILAGGHGVRRDFEGRY